MSNIKNRKMEKSIENLEIVIGIARC